VDVLVEVADRLRSHADIRLVCVGEGLLKDGMLANARRRGLANLTFLPFQPRERVADMQSAADVMLLTSSQRMGASSVPSKLITYLAVGRPVICAVTFDSEIAALVRQYELGMVVAPEDPDAVAAAIVSLRGIGPQALSVIGQRAREVALHRFSLEVAVGNFEALLLAVCRTVPHDQSGNRERPRVGTRNVVGTAVNEVLRNGIEWHARHPLAARALR